MYIISTINFRTADKQYQRFQRRACQWRQYLSVVAHHRRTTGLALVSFFNIVRDNNLCKFLAKEDSSKRSCSSQMSTLCARRQCASSVTYSIQMVVILVFHILKRNNSYFQYMRTVMYASQSFTRQERTHLVTNHPPSVGCLLTM